MAQMQSVGMSAFAPLLGAKQTSIPWLLFHLEQLFRRLPYRELKSLQMHHCLSNYVNRLISQEFS